MRRAFKFGTCRPVVAGFMAYVLVCGRGVAWAEIVTLKNGMQLEGILAREPSLNQNPLVAQPAGNVDVEKILLVDDDLRVTFVSTNQVRTGGIAPDTGIPMAKIMVPKRVASSSRRIGMVGSILQITPFDEYGNRVFSIQGPNGRIDVIQGITCITPRYTQVEGLQVKNAYEWDMRISTSSIPRETLSRILLRTIDQADPNERLRVVKLYIQAERYLDAVAELDRVIQDFPDLKGVERERAQLCELVAADVLREIELRRKAGQHLLVYTLLQGFPTKDVPGELLLRVSDLLGEYDEVRKRGEHALQLLADHVKQLDQQAVKAQIDALAQEIQAELNINNIGRLADYLRLADDDSLSVENKIALAFSGWILGSGAGIKSFTEAISLVDTRDAVRAYLRSSSQVERDEALKRLKYLDGATLENVAQILATMKPPLDIELPDEGVPGLLERSIPGLGNEPEFRYFVQLPPEYDPTRRYPCIVTLHGASSTPLSQIDWWAGTWNPDKRLREGQATRHGYIVIAPCWAAEHQAQYDYSIRAHAVVLGSLRDACRRLSIDTDRVFLTGHSMGGDAAWDIGLAHPDLWAGVLPIAAMADKYVSRYWKNAKGLPLYFVAGELDGNKLAVNARDLDRYLKYVGFDAMYVEYKGRGHEHFSDEILRMFDWMARYQRDFARKDFTVTSMRPWDQFFWWLELGSIPDRFVVLPANWPQPKAKDAETEARISPGNTIRAKTPCEQITIWLSPEFVDFSKKLAYGRDRVDIIPTLDVMLEDVRTRGDRQHPFWAKYSPPTGKRSPAARD